MKEHTHFALLYAVSACLTATDSYRRVDVGSFG